MKTEEKLAFQKGILEGLKLVEKMYKSGDLNPGNFIKLFEVHDDQLNYLEYVLELEQKVQPIISALPDTHVGNMPPPLPDPDPSEYVTNRMAPPPPPPAEKPVPPRPFIDMAGQIKNLQPIPPLAVKDTDRINRFTGEVTTQQPTVQELIVRKEDWFNGYIFGALTGSLCIICLMLIKTYLNGLR